MAPLFRIAVLPLALLLAACWAGKPFYSQGDLRAPIAPGLYHAFEAGSSEEDGLYQISIHPDGHTQFARLDGDARAQFAGFAPLPEKAGLFVAWLNPSPEKRGDAAGVFYGLLEPRGSEYILSFPVCGDPEMATCFYEDRGGLEAGLRRVAAEGPVETLRLVPVEKTARD